jgi:uncharacterized membrane protein
MQRSIAETAKSYMQIPFRRAVLRGLGVVLPPLLTIVLLAWVLTTVQTKVLTPVENFAKHNLARLVDQTLTEVPPGAERIDPVDSRDRQFRYEGQDYIAVSQDQWIPTHVYQRVRRSPGTSTLNTSHDYYHRYVELKYLKRFVVLPVSISLFVLTLYLLGRFLAYRIGRVVYNAMETIINQLPIIRTVYTSVKQVTDFVFNESELEFTRVVAVEYPRQGTWSLGFVTGEGLRLVAEKAGQPVVSVFVPTSPFPGTGFTVIVRRCDVVDLNMSVDQAIQYIVSGGVVVPLPQQYHVVGRQIQAAIGGKLQNEIERREQAVGE